MLSEVDLQYTVFSEVLMTKCSNKSMWVLAATLLQDPNVIKITSNVTNVSERAISFQTGHPGTIDTLGSESLGLMPGYNVRWHSKHGEMAMLIFQRAVLYCRGS